MALFYNPDHCETFGPFCFVMALALKYSKSAIQIRAWLGTVFFHILFNMRGAQKFVCFVLSIGYSETKYVHKIKNQIPKFLLFTFRLFYTLLKKGERRLFSPSKKTFSCPPFSKVYKKSCWIFIQKILVFSFKTLVITYCDYPMKEKQKRQLWTYIFWNRLNLVAFIYQIIQIGTSPAVHPWWVSQFSFFQNK